jgi:hypothetical protein
LAAVLIASPPPVARKTFGSSVGASELSRCASASAGRLATSPKIEYVSSSLIWAATASAISARPCPTLAYQRLALPS